MNTWKDIKTAPYDEQVLIATQGTGRGAGQWYIEIASRFTGGSGFPLRATHWMPLPDPPNMAKKKKVSQE